MIMSTKSESLDRRLNMPQIWMNHYIRKSDQGRTVKPKRLYFYVDWRRC